MKIARHAGRFFARLFLSLSALQFDFCGGDRGCSTQGLQWAMITDLEFCYSITTIHNLTFQNMHYPMHHNIRIIQPFEPDG